MNIGDEVVYNGDYGEILTGKLTAVGSDKDSYDDIQVQEVEEVCSLQGEVSQLYLYRNYQRQ